MAMCLQTIHPPFLIIQALGIVIQIQYHLMLTIQINIKILEGQTIMGELAIEPLLPLVDLLREFPTKLAINQVFNLPRLMKP